jgi:hypothetical protein
MADVQSLLMANEKPSQEVRSSAAKLSRNESRGSPEFREARFGLTSGSPPTGSYTALPRLTS